MSAPVSIQNLSVQVRAQWQKFFKPFPQVLIYTVDPGAYAIAQALYPILINDRRYVGWYAEGWARQRNSVCKPVGDMFSKMGSAHCLLLGSQTTYARTHHVLAFARERGTHSTFVFDHWKNYGKHFLPDLIPDSIVVTDALGKAALLAEIGTKYESRVTILPHLGLEASVQRMQGYKQRLPGVIAFLLDPTESSDGLGYCWRSILSELPSIGARLAPSAIFHVKPHPRQRSSEVEIFMKALGLDPKKYVLTEMNTERLMAAADEVWGMTTIALVAAHRSGKIIRSLQIGRNHLGREASNHFLESHLV